MSTSSQFAYFRPAKLIDEGYAYGSVEIGDDSSGQVNVDLILSGRWSEMSEIEKIMDASDVRFRVISEAEAISGVGTYVGSFVCIPRQRGLEPKHWDYGVVTGYHWDKNADRGTLTVAFADEAVDLPFVEEQLQELAVETYALRPCLGTPVVDLLLAEMIHKHELVYNMFHAKGRSGTRQSATIRSKAGVTKELNEKQKVPLYDLVGSAVHKVSIKYILDYSYYSVKGKRPVPKTVKLGDTIFDEPVSDPKSAKKIRFLPDMAGTFSDSGDDSDEDSDEDDDSDDNDDNPLNHSNSALKRPHAVDSSKPIMMKKTRVPRPPMVCPSRASTPDEVKGQFRPSPLQSIVNQAIVNGTYSSVGPQLLVEILQARVDTFSFLTHPAILRGLYGWDFGMRGLSIMHFVRLTWQERRETMEKYDMSNFSAKNKLPVAKTPSSLDDILEGLDGLRGVSREIFQPIVNTLLDTISEFFLRFRQQSSISDAETLVDLCFWINDRLELFRSLTARGDMEEASKVRADFNDGHPSYLRIVHSATDRRLTSLSSRQEKRLILPSNDRGDNSGVGGSRSRTGSKVEVPKEVLTLLPSANGKTLCMKYLANQTCKGKDGGCFYSYRGHFRPSSLHPKVRSFISSKYGGLKQEFQSL